MKRIFHVLALFFVVLPLKGWAEAGGVGGSSVAVAGILGSTTTVISTEAFVVPVEITTPTIVDAGETVSTPTPHAMMHPTDGVSFVTLTRTQFPLESLPAHADTVFPEHVVAFNPQNAGEIISHATSILFRPQGSSSYPSNAFVRGANANQTLVLMDGRPVEGVAFGAADLAEIPPERIDHIEIVRGGLSSLYGPNAVGGVINVLTKRATYPGFPLSHVSYESASFGRQTYRMDYGSRQGRLDYFFFADQQWESGFRSNSDHDQYNIGGNGGIAMGNAGKILFDASSFHNSAGVPGFRCDNILDPACIGNTTPLDPSQFNNKDEKPAQTPYARQTTDNNSLRTSYLVDLPHEMFLAVRLFGSQREVEADTSDRREHSRGGDAQVNLPLGLLVGGSFIHDEENFADRQMASNSLNVKRENWGLFAQETFHWDLLTLIPSGRFDQNSQFGDTSNPHVLGLFDATEWLRFSASAGRSFRAPTIDEAATNPDLNPEKAWSYEAGFTLHESSRSFQVNGFRADVGDLIQPGSVAYVNIGHARRQGVEVEITDSLQERVHHAINYTYLDNRGLPAGFDHEVVLPYSPRHTANYILTIIPKKRWSIDSTLRFEDSRFSGPDQTGYKMNAQLVWDLRLAYAWRQMDVFLGVHNVTNTRYVEVPGYPLPGATFFLGLRLRLWG